MLSEILAIVVGYLLGSISPAYFLGKILKGIDIREAGSGNAGARNVYRVLGLGPAIVTGTIDFSKGVLAILLTSLFAPPFFAYLSGIAAFLGHIFPFYLCFKAGQGGATAAGITIYFLVEMLVNDWFSLLAFLVLVASTLILLYITKLGPITGLINLPFFIAFILLEAPLNLVVCFALIVVVSALVQLFRQFLREEKEARLNKLFLDKKKELKQRKIAVRPVALLFPVSYLLSGRKLALILTGTAALTSILVDIFPQVSKKRKKINVVRLKRIEHKKREIKFFSVLSVFLLACFIILLIFSREIAVVALFFLITGGIAAQYFGVQYGRRKFFRKTLEGVLAYFAVTLLVGYLATYFLEISFLMIAFGAAVAAFFEAITIGIDENFAAGLTSASAMYLVKAL
ncbi:MAG: glycerol-3-phosphate acyltransferase [Candidatus Aminicenantales bacterium]